MNAARFSGLQNHPITSFLPSRFKSHVFRPFKNKSVALSEKSRASADMLFSITIATEGAEIFLTRVAAS